MEHRLAAALLCLLAVTPLAAAAGLPDAVASRGSLMVAVMPNYPPVEFRDPATDALAGFDIETEGSGDARIQSKQGRIDAAVQGSETLPYVMGQEPRAYAPLGAPITIQLNGIALPVKEAGLQGALATALDGLIADGTYKALLAKWHLSDNGIEKAAINAGR